MSRDPDRWATELTSSVVKVLGSGGRTAGTGFLAGERLVATCAHVVADAGGRPAGPVSVEFSGSVTRPGLADQALWRGPGHGDIAFLRLSEPAPGGARPLAFGSARGIRSHRVTTFGFPVNAPSGGHYGYAAAGDLIDGDGGGRLLQLTDCTEVTEGFSGGPVVDERTGLVVGMVTSVSAPDRLGRGRSTAYAAPAETLREICPDLTISRTCPYVGLRPFTAADAPLFHGRERAIGAVLASLRADPGFLALLGPSGSGKSSLVQAGVLPALARAELAGSDRWEPVTATPGTDPYAHLTEAGLTGAGGGLAAAARSWLAARPGCDRLVLILDQFEELLVQPTPGDRARLLRQLVELDQQALPVTVIIAMRDDFYSTLAAAAPAAMPLVERGLVNVPAVLEPGELTAIITEPAAGAGLTLEPSLAERIAADAARVTPPSGAAASGAPVTVLPLLSSALAELWERQQNGRLAHEMYERMGGLVGWLDRWCDRAYAAARAKLPAGQRQLTRQVLTSLVRPGDRAAGVPATRQRRTIEQILGGRAEPGQPPAPDPGAVLRALADQRLVTTSRDPARDVAVAELAHESLIHEWRLLRRWLEEDQEFLAWRRDLEADYERWQRTASTASQRDPGLLLHGTALDAARRWLRSRPAELPAALTRFVNDSDHAERERLTRDRLRAARFRLLAMVAGISAAVAAGLFGFALDQTVRAQHQAARATQQARIAQAGKLAGESIGLATSQPDLAALLGLQSVATASSQADWGSLETVLSQQVELSRVLYGSGSLFKAVAFSPGGTLVAAGDENGQVRIWNVATGRQDGAAFPPGSGFSGDTVQDLAFSPTGRVLAVMGDNGLQLWNPVTHARIGRPLLGSRSSLLGSVAFSRDGKTLAAAYSDQISLWNTATWQPIGRPMATRSGNITSAAFSPDGRTVAITSDVGFVQRWDVASQRRLSSQVVPKGADQVAFSPGGSQLAVASYGGAVYLLDPGTGKLTGQLPGTTSPAETVAYSPDGKTLAVGDGQGVVRLWNPATGQQVGVPLLGHTDRIDELAFSPDGTHLASASDDGTVRVWSFTVRQPLGTPLTGHAGSVHGIAFSPDGRTVATAGEDQTARLWDAATASRKHVLSPVQTLTNVPVGLTPYPVNGVAFSPDGKLLATAGSQVRLWDARTGRPVADLYNLPGGGQQRAVAFSPDGKLLATAGDAGIRLWHVATRTPDGGTLPRSLGQAGEGPFTVAFSPDGKLLAADGVPGIDLWNVATRSYAGSMKMPDLSRPQDFSAIAFSPDGKLLAAAAGSVGEGPEIQLWNMTGRQRLGAPFGTQPNGVDSVAFSPDGRLLATGGGDGSIDLWDVATRTQFGTTLKLHTATVSGLAFNRTGTQFGSASADGTARLWAAPRTWIQQACQLAGRNLSLAEWRHYVGGTQPYGRDCPQYPSGDGAPPGAPAASYPRSP